MRILVLGSGAREHAIVAALQRDSQFGGESHDIIVAPGNAGMAAIAQTVRLDVNNPKVVVSFAESEGIDLVVIGPEAPLVAGVADALRKAHVAVFGPNRAAAAIEGSKAFAKDIMASAHVPTARSVLAKTLDEARSALDEFSAPYVVKADGLAAGKGVLVTESLDAAISHVHNWISDGPVLIEEHLAGREVSLFYVSDGQRVVPLAPAQDYKRAYAGDAGPNTGGMGAYSPLPWLAGQFRSESAFIDEVTRTVAAPVVRELASRGTEFRGLLYCGLIVTVGGIRVIEFNARFGDPETQVVLARLRSPLAPLLLASANGDLSTVSPPEFSADRAVTVVLASEGYPEGSAPSGRVLGGLVEASAVDGVELIHAATLRDGDALVASGGRVINVVAQAPNFRTARDRAYEALSYLTLDGSHYRADIAVGLD